MVDILNQGYCNGTLKEGLSTPPKVLCVAKNESHRTEFFHHTNGGGFLKDDKLDLHTKNALMNRDQGWFVVGTGKVLQNGELELLK